LSSKAGTSIDASAIDAEMQVPCIVAADDK